MTTDVIKLLLSTPPGRGGVQPGIPAGCGSWPLRPTLVFPLSPPHPRDLILGSRGLEPPTLNSVPASRNPALPGAVTLLPSCVHFLVWGLPFLAHMETRTQLRGTGGPAFPPPQHQESTGCSSRLPAPSQKVIPALTPPPFKGIRTHSGLSHHFQGGGERGAAFPCVWETR